MMIQAIIFDLDGTLIDSVPDITNAANCLLKNHGMATYTMADYTRWVGHGALSLLEKAIPEKRDEFDIKQLLNEYLELYSEKCTSATTVYSGIPALLDILEIRKISISILTNKPHAITEKTVRHFFPGTHFRFIMGQKPGFAKKPDPECALFMASKLKIEPENILFIGDSETDIKTGNAAGMITAGVGWGYGTADSMKKAGSDYFFNSVNELIEFISKTTQE
jgi:phosphoglycolate phosphatase